MASKFVFSLDGTKTGSTSFLSSASKSIGLKNGLSVKLSKVFAPIRFSTFSSSAELIACRQTIETGGEVTGNLGVAAVICWDRTVCVLPSNGRYRVINWITAADFRVSYLIIYALIKQNAQ